MNKLRVIDLLNKIANDDIPKKIIYDGTIYKYDNYSGDIGYVDKTQLPCKWFTKEIECDIKDYLNEEIEIIEEDKKIPEKIDVNHLQQIKKWKRAKILGNKINEIIDYLEEKEC